MAGIKILKKSVVTLGVFDGVHRGHQEIFRQVVRRAKAIRGTSVVYTFDPHPVKVLAPDACPLMINTLAQRVELISSQGIQKVVVERFTRSFARQSPHDFFHRTLVRRLHPQEIFVGYDFTFGVHRSGTIEHLEGFGRETGIRVTIVPARFFGETLVSSSRIRQLLVQGDLPKAEELLGRPYFIEGKVVRGRGIGGKQLGLHTANLKTENDLILPAGVYSTTVILDGRRFKGVSNIGPNPTFGPGPLSIETHLFNFRKNIRGKKIRLEFLRKIREEITFATPADLARQIRNDIQSAKQYFRAHEEDE